MSLEEHESDNQEKYGTAQDDSEESDEGPYEEDHMFSDNNFEGLAFLQDVTCNMNDKARNPYTVFYWTVNQQWTVDVFKNKNLLKNIRDAKKALSLHCNAGIATVDKIGDLPGYRIV